MLAEGSTPLCTARRGFWQEWVSAGWLCCLQAQSSDGNILSDSHRCARGHTCDSAFLGDQRLFERQPRTLGLSCAAFSSPISGISGCQGLCQTPAIPTERDKYHPKYNNINTYNNIKIIPNRSDVCACLAGWHTAFPQIFAASNPDETEKFLGCRRTRCLPSPGAPAWKNRMFPSGFSSSTV